MPSPISIVPLRPTATPVAQPSAAALPERPLPDEPLDQALRRRLRYLVEDERAKDPLVMLLLAIPWCVATFLLLEIGPFDWTIDVNSPQWRWITDVFTGSALAKAAIVAVKVVALLLLVPLAGLAALAVRRWGWLGFAITLLAGWLVYSYVPGLMNARASWNNPQYSHGWLVPLCSLMLLLWWRRPLAPVTPSAQLVGGGLIVASLLFRLACARYRIVTLDMYTFVPVLAGVFLLVGGWRTFRWAWAPIAVLIFMYPLPDEANRYLLGPLQTGATVASTFALQTLGFDAFREGNKIIIGDHVLGVVDACSGLRMLTIFIWLAFMIVLVMGGEWWENLAILALAVPIAMLVNVIRITVTGVLYTFNAELAEWIFHDLAGLVMMPMALVFLFAAHLFLSRLVVEEEVAPAVIARTRATGSGPAPVSVGLKAPETRFRRQDGPAGGN